MARWGRSRAMEGATPLTSPPRRGQSTEQLTSTIAALQYVYDRTHAGDRSPVSVSASVSGHGAAGTSPAAGAAAVGRAPGWTFLSDHARLLVCLAEHPDRPLREVVAAAAVSTDEARAILADLLDAGYVQRLPGSRPARFVVDRERPLHHPAERGPRVGDLLAAWSRTRSA